MAFYKKKQGGPRYQEKTWSYNPKKNLINGRKKKGFHMVSLFFFFTPISYFTLLITGDFWAHFWFNLGLPNCSAYSGLEPHSTWFFDTTTVRGFSLVALFGGVPKKNDRSVNGFLTTWGYYCLQPNHTLNIQMDYLKDKSLKQSVNGFRICP